MRRVVLPLVLVALTPLLLGAGGANPGVPLGFRIGGPTYNAAVVLDPHALATDVGNTLGQNVTTRAKEASIRIFYNEKAAGLLFDIPTGSGFPLFRGCDLSLTDTRFRFVPLSTWIPAPALTSLFAELGQPISPEFDPVITRIVNPACTTDPDNPGPITDGGDGGPSEAGILSFNAVIRFLVPDP